MEARASFNGSSVSKTFVAAILVLVALGLGAMGGYVAKGLTGSGSAATENATVHAAPGSVLRQDSVGRSTVHAAPGSVLRQDSVSGPAAEVPAWIRNEFPETASRFSQDDPIFIAKYAVTTSQAADDGTGGVLWNRGGHKQLP